MLYQFLAENETDLIERCSMKAAERPLPKDASVHHGIPVFIRQLTDILRVEKMPGPIRNRRISGPSGGGRRAPSEMSQTATIHGRELLGHGFTVDQVVHAYGDVCQSIADLAVERAKPFQVDEFRTLNRCLDDAIADAVTEFSYQRDTLNAYKQSAAMNLQVGMLAHELRNLIHTATLTFAAIKAGTVGMSGSTGTVMDSTLLAMRGLVDSSVAEVRMDAGMPMHSQIFALMDLIVELKSSAALEADIHKCLFFVASVDSELAIEADRHLLAAAISNLLQNAFKFTHPGTEVTLSAYGAGNHILIDVADHCGGLPWSDPEKVFLPFAQGGTDKRGLGSGLSVSRRSVEANKGTLRVQDRPGVGCVFTIDLPRHSTQECPRDARKQQIPS
jgi:signal transduction histidine kinase